jgi:hypothetical protein
MNYLIVVKGLNVSPIEFDLCRTTKHVGKAARFAASEYQKTLGEPYRVYAITYSEARQFRDFEKFENVKDVTNG